jgi:hypothetical protein
MLYLHVGHVCFESTSGGPGRLLHCNMSYMPMLNSIVKRVLLRCNKIRGFFLSLASAA